MKRVLPLLLLIVVALAAALAIGAASGCSGKKASGTPTPQCTPPPAVGITVVVDGKNAQSFAGRIAAARFVEGTADVAFCTTTLVASMGTFGPFGGQTSSPFLPNPRLELILNTESGSAWAFGAGDEHYAYGIDTSGQLSGTDCDSTRTWTVTFDHATATQAPVSWPLGTRCP